MVNKEKYGTFGLFERVGIMFILLFLTAMSMSALWMFAVEHGGGGPDFDYGMNLLTQTILGLVVFVMLGRPIVAVIGKYGLIGRLKKRLGMF